MNVSRVYFWKEWHEQRAGVLGLLILLPCIPLFLAVTGNGSLLNIPGLDELGAASGFVATVFLIGTHLIPTGEDAGGTSLVRRIPGGLSRSFFAKLSFFLLALAGGALYGGLIGQATGSLLGYGDISSSLFESRPAEAYVLAAICAALWVFAVSSWVPSGALAFPVGLLTCAILCWPGTVLFLPSSWSAAWYVPRPWEPAAILITAFGAALASGWASYGVGLRYRSHKNAPLLLGLLVALACVSPMWGWMGYRWHWVTALDVQDEDFHIETVFPGVDSSEALVIATHRDLKGRFHFDGVKFGANAQHKVYRVNLETGNWAISELEFSTPSEIPAGFRFADYGYVRPVEIPGIPEAAWVSGAPQGWGHRVRLNGRGNIGFYDRLKESYHPIEELPPLPAGDDNGWSRARCYVLPSLWLVSTISHGEPEPGMMWFEYREETRTLSKARYLAGADLIRAVFSDGSLLVLRNQQLILLDPVSGRERPIQLRNAEHVPTDLMSIHSRGILPADSPTALSVASYEGDPTWIVALLDPEQASIRALRSAPARVLDAQATDAPLILTGNRAIERLDCRTGQTTRLFPRTE